MALPAPDNNSQGRHIAKWNRKLPPVPARGRSNFLKVLGAALTLVVMVFIFTALLRRAGDSSSPVLTPSIVPTPGEQPFSTTNNSAGVEILPPRPTQELLPWATDVPVSSPPVMPPPPQPSLNTSNASEGMEAAPPRPTPTQTPSTTSNRTEGMETARPRPVHEVLPFTASANFETEQLPVQHASWWWSLPVVNILCTACLVELMWQLLAGVASSYIMNKVKALDDCTLSYLELCFLRLVLMLCKFLRQHQDVWVPVVTHSSFVGLTTAGLVTLAVGLINVAPTNPLWAYLVIRGTLSLATSMATSLTPDTPHSTPPSAVASTVTDQPSVIAPSKPATATTKYAFHSTEMPSVDELSTRAPPPLPSHKRLSTSPVRGLVSAQHIEPHAPEVVEAPLAHLPPLKSLPNSDAHHDEVFVGKALASTATDALDDFSFGAPTHAPTSPPLPHAKDASTGADFKGFPKLAPPLQSSPCPLPPPSCSPDTPEIIKAQPGPTLTLNPKASGKSTFTPHVPAIMRSRTPAQTTHSPSPTPLKSLMSALGGSPAAGSPLLEQPAPQTPMGSPMNWSPTPIVGDAAPKGDPNNALNPPTEAVSKTPAVLTTEPHPTEPRPTGTPLKAFFKAITPPVKSLGKAKKSPIISKAQAEAPPLKTSAKLLSPLKHLFASSAPTAQAQPDSAAPPLSSSLAPGPRGEANPAPSAALGTATVTLASVTALPPSHSLTQASLPPVHSEVSAPAAEAAAYMDISSPTNRMASFLGTSRIPIRNPDTACSKVSESVLARLVSSRPSSLRQAHHRADLPQSVSVAAAKPPSRNPFAARGLNGTYTSALPPAPAPRGSLLTGRSILRRLANKGKENAGSADHSQGQSAVVGGVSSRHNDGHAAHDYSKILDSSVDCTLTPMAAPLSGPSHTHVSLTAAQSAYPDQATVHAPHKPWGFRSPVLEGTKLFKLGKLDRGKAKGVRRVGQGPKKLPPAPTHRPIRPVLPATPLGSNSNDLLMGGRQLDFDRVEVFPIGGLSYMCD